MTQVPNDPIDVPDLASHADLSPTDAADYIRAQNPRVISTINNFTHQTFQTRGGRLGSGMGLLLEGLWGYHMSRALAPHGIEIGWIPDDQYNDYACIDAAAEWDPVSGGGELFRIEAKTMNVGADESKAHFAELQNGINENDLLLVLTWSWEFDGTGRRVWPKIVDVFLDRALPLAELRDELHIARGGSFVSRYSCPDGCKPLLCQHDGEPLNSRGKRERLSGPEATRPSLSVSFAANFGGLFRMIATRGSESKEVLRRVRATNATADSYVAFVNRSRGRIDASVADN